MSLSPPFRAAHHAPPTARSAFTMVELLVVTFIFTLLLILMLPAARDGLAAGRRAACVSNLHHLQFAFQMYLDEHNGSWFPWREVTSEGVLWYFGLERAGGSSEEGSRSLDKTRARLAPYLGHTGGVELCPSMPLRAPYFKRKFQYASYGYGINAYMLDGLPGAKTMGVSRAQQVALPSDTVTWADAIQINTFQAPASPSNPMLEEWYFLDGLPLPKFHFRHQRTASTAFADGSVRSMSPYVLDSRCDGLVGYLRVPRDEWWLITRKK